MIVESYSKFNKRRPFGSGSRTRVLAKYGFTHEHTFEDVDYEGGRYQWKKTVVDFVESRTPKPTHVVYYGQLGVVSNPYCEVWIKSEPRHGARYTPFVLAIARYLLSDKPLNGMACTWEIAQEVFPERWKRPQGRGALIGHIDRVSVRYPKDFGRFLSDDTEHATAILFVKKNSVLRIPGNQ